MTEYEMIMGPGWNCPECHSCRCSDWQAQNVYDYECRECGTPLVIVEDDE